MAHEHSNLDSAFEYARGSGRSPAVPGEQRWSEFLYRNLASMAPGYVFEYRFNAQGQPEAVWASEGVEAVLGCTLGEIERRGGWDALIDEAWKPLARARQQRLLEGEPQSGELRIKTIAGDDKWMEINLQPVRDPGTGTVTGIVGSAYDITTRKVAVPASLSAAPLARATRVYESRR